MYMSDMYHYMTTTKGIDMACGKTLCIIIIMIINNYMYMSDMYHYMTTTKVIDMACAKTVLSS
jgi:hypothetical protein